MIAAVAARHCNNCRLLYPADGKHQHCTVCGEGTQYTLSANTPSDWEERVRHVLAVLDDSRFNAVRNELLHRIHKLFKIGVPWEIATEMAARRSDTGTWQVDIGLVERHVKRGATPLQAVRIEG